MLSRRNKVQKLKTDQMLLTDNAVGDVFIWWRVKLDWQSIYYLRPPLISVNLKWPHLLDNAVVLLARCIFPQSWFIASLCASFTFLNMQSIYWKRRVWRVGEWVKAGFPSNASAKFRAVFDALLFRQSQFFANLLSLAMKDQRSWSQLMMMTPREGEEHRLPWPGLTLLSENVFPAFLDVGNVFGV